MAPMSPYERPGSVPGRSLLAPGDHGTCTDQGEIHIVLDDIVADDSGDGIEVTASDTESMDYWETGHYLAVWPEDGPPIGGVVACPDVIAVSAPATPTPTVARATLTAIL